MADDTLKDDLRRNRDYWESHARHDPLWAILSDPTRKGRRWNTEQFFETGRREIALLMQDLARVGYPARRDRALDFGCGVGRLSLALSSYFRGVTGLDISPKMIDLARQLHARTGNPEPRTGSREPGTENPEPGTANREPGTGRLRFISYDGSSVSGAVHGPFDLIYSDIVLQHVPPAIALRYVAEFVGLLSDRGIAVFQLPSTRRPPSQQTVAPSAMPDIAYTHRLELLSTVPHEVRGADVLRLHVRVTNAGDYLWDQTKHGSLRLGNHWLDESGTMIVQDDGRASLPPVLASNEQVELFLDVTAPSASGLLVCELDLVHEGITWFADRGARTVRRDVRIAKNDEHHAVPVFLEAPEEVPLPATNVYELLHEVVDAPDDFPMHGTPPEDVIGSISRAGGRVIHTEPDGRGGAEWLGFRYFVVR